MKLIQVGDASLEVTEHPEHEWTLTTKQVAEGYGVSEVTIRRHIQDSPEDLIQGKHFISVQNLNSNPRAGIPHKQTLWTKRGVVRLGFFIKSERARAFRDLAEDLVIHKFAEELHTSYVGLFLQEIPVVWEQQFSDSFFKAVCDCYGLRYIKGRTPGFFGGFINRYIYDPLLSNLSNELKAKRSTYCDDAKKEDSNYKLHQFLADNCKDALNRHIRDVETILAVSRDEVEFKENFATRFEGVEQLRMEFQTKAERRKLFTKRGMRNRAQQKIKEGN